MNDSIQTNSLHAWILAARPKTLTGAVVPVLMGSALAVLDRQFAWIPASICLLFAILMQIAANFINDLYDFLKGSDREDRLGPARACAQGWISPRAMRGGIAATVGMAGAIGCALIGYGGWYMVWIGVASVVFAFLYTVCLSYYGWGDLLVIVFFGLIAVGITYYVQTLQWTMGTTLVSSACGFVIETLLVVNNYRDREADRYSHKLTLVVRFGERFGGYLYLYSGVLAALLMLSMLQPSGHIHPFTALLPLLYLWPHCRTWREMMKIHSGKKLNGILGKTSRNMMLFGLLSSIGMILDSLFFA